MTSGGGARARAGARSGRAGARPATRRSVRPRSRAAVATTPAVAPDRRAGRVTLTTRAAVLALAACAVLLAVGYPLKQYLAQRSTIAAARAQQDALEQEVALLTKQHANADSPAQIEAEARARLHLTFPGTTNYIVVAPPGPAAAPVTHAGHAAVPRDAHATWYGRLWDSDRQSGGS